MLVRSDSHRIRLRFSVSRGNSERAHRAADRSRPAVETPPTDLASLDRWDEDPEVVGVPDPLIVGAAADVLDDDRVAAEPPPR